MSIITPSDTALAYLAQLTIGQQRFDISEVSDSNGHSATRLGGPPRWTASLRTLDALEPSIAGLWKAAAARLRGRANHLALYDVTQPEPRGTARGNITLASTAAAGAASLVLAGASGANAILGGSFETDSNADGVANGWVRFSAGSTGTVSAFLDPGNAVTGGLAQVLVAGALGAGGSNYHGIYQVCSVAHLAGQSVSAGVWAVGTAGTTVVLAVNFLDALGGPVLPGLTAAVTASGGAQFLEAPGSVPASAVSASFEIYHHSGTGAAAALYVDGAQFVRSPVGAYPPPATLLAGDMLQVGTGVGSHYCMVTEDASATDGGAITVAIEPPTRKSFSSGAVVAWNKPRGHFKQRPDSVSWSGVAGGTGSGGFAFDLMEDWTA